MKVIGVKRDPKTVEDKFKGVADEVVGFQEIGRALGSADYVVASLPLTPDTRHLFNETLFSQMKPSAHFLNVGRGQTVKEADLIQALNGGTIAGAYLDVFEVEPLPPSSPLWTMDNVFITPHCADNVADTWDATVNNYLERLVPFIEGKPLPHPVSKQKGY